MNYNRIIYDITKNKYIFRIIKNNSCRQHRKQKPAYETTYGSYRIFYDTPRQRILAVEPDSDSKTKTD